VIAILEARQAGLLRREHLLPNLVAGTIVGVVALPLAMVNDYRLVGFQLAIWMAGAILVLMCMSRMSEVHLCTNPGPPASKSTHAMLRTAQ
jgi:hypothetical protein